MTTPASLGTVLLCCDDQKGIVAAMAQVLYGHGANIIDADQHTDVLAGKFFQRIRFDASKLHTDRVSLERGMREVSDRFSMGMRLEYADRRKRVAILVSKVDHCLYDLLLRARAGELDCDIPLVVSNHERLRSVAEHFGVPFEHVPNSSEGRGRAEDAMLALLKAANVDLVVLARYMQILTPGFVANYENQIINIHHSFLPAFVGSNPYRQAHERGVKLIGATAHYVTDALDEGPIIDQNVTRCSHRDAVKDLVRKGRNLEKTVLAAAVRVHLESRVLVYGNKTVVFD